MSTPRGRDRARRRWRVADAESALQRIAPTEAARSWDNVGLIAGDPRAPVRRALTCIDLTPEVVDEAIAGRYELVVAYHPPIFKPIARIRADAPGAESQVFRCVGAGVAIYAMHTALDAAEGGTNDVLARLCGVEHPSPLGYAEPTGPTACKIVTFVPTADVEGVSAAMFAAGAGHIGDYAECSFRAPGTGTFRGGASTNPAVGRRGRRERVDEVRLETVVPARRLAAVVAALRGAHPYEEPAFDLYPLRAAPMPGVGRLGNLRRPTTLRRLARKLKRALHARSVAIVGADDQPIERVVVVAGAAGSWPLTAPSGADTAVVTGEIRHHDALTYARRGTAAIALGHWTSERPVLASVARRLSDALPGVAVDVSVADAEPFRAVV